MRTHREIQLVLYDYLQKALPDGEQSEVEAHIRVCDECRHELESFRSVLASLGTPEESPSEQLPESYWRAFANSVDARVRRERKVPVKRGERLLAAAGEFLSVRWKPLVAGSWALALALLAFLLTQQSLVDEPPVPEPAVTAQETSIDTSAARVQQYLRKSKSLLVGLTNMKIAKRAPVDFAVERRTSRELAEESRLLRREPLDPRGRRLVGDLEKIFIELANTPENGALPAVEMVRSGIEQENLLFKIRMAETAYGHARIMTAGMRR
jgi:hypothetical protein